MLRDVTPLRTGSWVIGMVAVALVTGAPGPRAAATTAPADPSRTLHLVADTIGRVVYVLAAVADSAAAVIGSIDPTQPGWLLAGLVAPGLIGLAVILLTIVWPLIDESAAPTCSRHAHDSAEVVPLARGRGHREDVARRMAA